MLMSLKHVSVAALLSLMSIVSISPALAGDPFVSLKMTRLPAGTMAAPFELTTLDGKVVKSSELAGKVVLINFWATWCGPCKEEMPSLARLQKQLDSTLRPVDRDDGSPAPRHRSLSLSFRNQPAGALR